MQRTIKSRWVHGWQFVATDSENHSIVLDSPEMGENTGNSPNDLILVAAAGCTAMDVISILKKKRQRVVDFEVNVTGERQDEHPKVWRKIHTSYIVRGHDIDRAAVERAVELSENKYCPVQGLLREVVEFSHSIEIEELDSVE